MVTGLLATVIITVFALIYWPSVKEPARQQLGNCVPGAIRGKLTADSCSQPVAAVPTASQTSDDIIGHTCRCSAPGGTAASAPTSPAGRASPPDWFAILRSHVADRGKVRSGGCHGFQRGSR